MPPLINVVALVLIVAILFVVLILPAIRRGLARSAGVLVTARVKAIEQTATYDELHRHHHRVVLEVALPGRAPYEVTVKQVLPWLHGQGSSLQQLQVRAHPRIENAVVIIGPAPRV